MLSSFFFFRFTLILTVSRFAHAKPTTSYWLWQNNHVIVFWSLIVHIYLALENFPLHIPLHTCTLNINYDAAAENSHWHFRSFPLNFSAFQNHFGVFRKFKFLKRSLYFFQNHHNWYIFFTWNFYICTLLWRFRSCLWAGKC